MNINVILENILNYAANNRAGAIASIVIFLFILLRKPKLIIVILFLAAIAMGVAMLFEALSGYGIRK